MKPVTYRGGSMRSWDSSPRAPRSGYGKQSHERLKSASLTQGSAEVYTNVSAIFFSSPSLFAAVSLM